jgi:hypothetical protein
VLLLLLYSRVPRLLCVVTSKSVNRSDVFLRPMQSVGTLASLMEIVLYLREYFLFFSLTDVSTVFYCLLYFSAWDQLATELWSSTLVNETNYYYYKHFSKHRILPRLFSTSNEHWIHSELLHTYPHEARRLVNPWWFALLGKRIISVELYNFVDCLLIVRILFTDLAVSLL